MAEQRNLIQICRIPTIFSGQSYNKGIKVGSAVSRAELVPWFRKSPGMHVAACRQKCVGLHGCLTACSCTALHVSTGNNNAWRDCLLHGAGPALKQTSAFLGFFWAGAGKGSNPSPCKVPCNRVQASLIALRERSWPCHHNSHRSDSRSPLQLWIGHSASATSIWACWKKHVNVRATGTRSPNR